MLTALHVTLPKGRDNQRKKGLPDRCLVANEVTREVSLISTEASLKYENYPATDRAQDGGTHFRFNHIAISPHHGSIFVTLVAPLLYDMCRSFLLSSKESGGDECPSGSGGQLANPSDPSTSRGSQHILGGTSTGRCRTPSRHMQSQRRTVFVYGSHSTTERRALFLHLAKRTAQVLLRQTDISNPDMKGIIPCKVSFSIIDLYHAWGVADVLDPNAVLHDAVKLESLRREQPRRSLNEPKGIAFVAPTQETLDSNDHASQCILRALQRAESPRALRTDTEREDHAVNSTLVLSFTLSRPRNSEAMDGKISVRQRINVAHSNAFAHEAKFHLILLPDSTAAAHRKQVAQELSALAGALQACTRWCGEGILGEEIPAHGVDGVTEGAKGGRNSGKHPDISAAISSPPWAPLRESPLLLYLFESTVYYLHQLDRCLRHLRVAAAEKHQQHHHSRDESRSVSANTSSYSLCTTESRGASGNARAIAQYGLRSTSDENYSNIIDCIASGLGKCLVVVCVNSGWDHYYQARSAFLFVRRVTNQSGPLRSLIGSKTVWTSSQASGPPASLPTTRIQSPCALHTYHHTQHEDDEKGERKKSCQPKQGSSCILERRLWPSPPQADNTEPRPPHPMDFPLSPQTPSDVTIIDDESNEGNSDGKNEFHVKNVSPPSFSMIKESPPQKHITLVGDSLSRTNHLPVSSLWKDEDRTTHQQFLHPGKVKEGTGVENVDGSLKPASLFIPMWRRHPYGPEEEGKEEPVTLPEVTCMHTLEATGLKPSSASRVSSSPTKCTVPGVVEEVVSNTMETFLERQAVLIEENQKLRALLALHSSHEADEIVKKRELIRIVNVCDAGLVQSHMAVRSCKVKELQRSLSVATKKLQVLKRGLSRSVEENRKLRHTVQHHLHQCLTNLPRVFCDAVGESGSASSNITEERIRHWEKLLEAATKDVQQIVRERTYSEEKKELMEGGRVPAHSHDVVDSLCCQKEEFSNCFPVDSIDTHPVEQEQLRGRSSSCGGGAKVGSKLKIADDSVDEKCLSDSVKTQVLELLQIASFLFLDRSPCDKENTAIGPLRELLGEKRWQICGGARVSFSQNVLDILSPRVEKQQEQKVEKKGIASGERPEQDLCWKCHAHQRSHEHAAYIRFIELLRSLCTEIRPDGVFDRTLTSPQKESQGAVMSTVEQLQVSRAPAPAPAAHSPRFCGKLDELSRTQNKATLLMHARQLSDSLQQRTDAHQNERASMERMGRELDKEREWRRQLQDRVIQLHLRLRKYEAKFNFFDETVKPRLTNGIEELERMVSQRDKRDKLDKERRVALVSEIKKRLECAASEANLEPTISLSMPSFLLRSSYGN